MSIKLRTGENTVARTNIHPMFHRSQFVWAVLLTLLFVIGHFASHDLNKSFGAVIFTSFLFGWLPFLYSYARYKTTHYYVTNLRLYIASGILSNKQQDIPITKINDVEFQQSLSDRIYGTGRLLTFTGNDRPTKIARIEKPEEFREAIISLIGQMQNKAA